jgi:hypothetical protein
MIKFIPILSDVITEQKRHKFDSETYAKIHSVVDKLWNDRNIEYKGKTIVDHIPITLKDRTQGQVQLRVNPRLKYIGYMGTKPKDSRDPMDMYIEVNPKFYESKKNLYLTLYHELIHAIDPTQTTKLNQKYQTTYNEKSDKMYWGHPIEFFAITNEFLEGLVLEFKRRSERIRNEDNRKYLNKSFKNILGYFAKGEKLTKVSTDILYKINDEYVNDNEISKVLDDLITNNPQLADYIKMPNDIPYFLNYIQLIKKYNPKIWPRFLTMLYKTKDEIEDIINKKRDLN